MTVTRTEPGEVTRKLRPQNKVPYYLQAVSILLKIASPLFDAAVVENRVSLGETQFQRWLDIRQTASILLAQRHTTLNAADRDRLERGLQFAQEHYSGLIQEFWQVCAEAGSESAIPRSFVPRIISAVDREMNHAAR
jgi:hypothetical protein